MSMTKKDFVALADALRPVAQQHQIRVQFELSTWPWADVVEPLLAFMAQQNPRFDRDRWLAYLHGECGPSGGKVK